jgi:hypothetical protein
MGLDMYLYKQIKGEDNKIDVVAYWRKANQVHNWFVTNVQNGVDNCEPHPVTEQDIVKLLNICNQILELDINYEEQMTEIGVSFKDGKREPIMDFVKVIDNEEVVETMHNLLPTAEGFFFGSTDYDEWYIEDIKSTAEQLNHVLEETDFKTEELFYNSSW